ncbi:MAG: hypothetical protein MUF04_05810 [Akkermansiaceae bacterium]|jgi:hypothetical protein|nr:hypothetical protein [Akkermansiaceae bacterium]
MKPSTSDYLSITAALVAILLCGFGVGFLVGERITLKRVAATTAADHAPPDWSAETVTRLTRELKLTPPQVAAVEKEVAAAAREIAAAKRVAIRDYQRALLELHLRLLPHLEPGQRRVVEKSCEILKSSLDKWEDDSED